MNPRPEHNYAWLLNYASWCRILGLLEAIGGVVVAVLLMAESKGDAGGVALAIFGASVAGFIFLLALSEALTLAVNVANDVNMMRQMTACIANGSESRIVDASPVVASVPAASAPIKRTATAASVSKANDGFDDIIGDVVSQSRSVARPPQQPPRRPS